MPSASGFSELPEPFEPLTGKVEQSQWLAVSRLYQEELRRTNPGQFVQDPEFRNKNRNIGEKQQEMGNENANRAVHPLSNDPNTSALDNAITNLPANSNDEEIERALQNELRNRHQKKLGLSNSNIPKLRLNGPQ